VIHASSEMLEKHDGVSSFVAEPTIGIARFADHDVLRRRCLVLVQGFSFRGELEHGGLR
jgi:hypothetical protein